LWNNKSALILLMHGKNMKTKCCVRLLIIGTIHVAKFNLSNQLFVH
jgi:hypothetical protein